MASVITFTGLYSTVAALANRGNRVVIDGLELTDNLWNPLECTKATPGSGRLVVRTTAGNVLPSSGAIVNFVNETTGTQTNGSARYASDGTYHIEVPASLEANATYSIVIVTDSGYGVAPQTINTTNFPQWSVSGNVILPALFSNTEHVYPLYEANLSNGVTENLQYISGTDTSNVDGQNYTITVSDTSFSTGNNTYVHDRLDYSVTAVDDFSMATLRVSLDLVQKTGISPANIFQPGHQTRLLVRQGDSFIHIGHDNTADPYGYSIGVGGTQTTAPGSVGIINDDAKRPPLHPHTYKFKDPRFPIRLPRGRFPQSWCESIVDISLGSGGGMACDKTGHVWVWGYPNWYNSTYHNFPVGANPFNISTYNIAGNELYQCGTKIVKVRLAGYGYPSFYAIGENGRLWRWGHNGNGQLATNSTASLALPSLMPYAPYNIVDVRGAQQSAIFLTQDGYVYVTGYNSYNTMGGGLTLNTAYNTPTRIYGAAGERYNGTARKIYTSQYNMWVLLEWTNGVKYVDGWGYNAHYQLGTNNTNNYNSYFTYNVGGYEVVDFAVNPVHQCQCALLMESTSDSSQRLYTWGYRSPLLGNASYVNADVPYFTTNNILDSNRNQGSFGMNPTLTNVYMDPYHAYALDTTGVLHQWGATPNMYSSTSNVVPMQYLHPLKYGSYPYPYWSTISADYANVLVVQGRVNSNLVANLTDVVDSANLSATPTFDTSFTSYLSNVDANVVGTTSLSTVEEFRAYDADPSEYYGTNVVVSSDGSRMAVSAPWTDNLDTGTVYVYRKDNMSSGVWRLEDKLIYTKPDSDFGWRLAMDNAGTRLVITADWEIQEGSALASGAAYVYKRTDTSWSLESTLLSPNPQDWGGFGQSVCISGDGSVVVVGEAYHSEPGYTSCGAAHIFVRSTAGSLTLAQTLLPVDTDGTGYYAGAWYGESVSIDNDGSRITVCAPQAAVPTVYVYSRANDGLWNLETRILEPASGGDKFGIVAKLSTDGTSIIALEGRRSSDGGGTFAASAHMYGRSSNVWTLQQSVLGSSYSTPGTTNSLYSVDVAFAGNGSRFGLLWREGSDSLKTEIFDLVNSTWTLTDTVQHTINFTVSSGPPWKGAMSFNNDGELMAQGLHYQDSGAGAVVLYSKSPSSLVIDVKSESTASSNVMYPGSVYADGQVSTIELGALTPSYGSGFTYDANTFSISPEYDSLVTVEPSFYTNADILANAVQIDRTVPWTIAINGTYGLLSADTVQTVRAKEGDVLTLVTKPSSSPAIKLVPGADPEVSAYYGCSTGISTDGTRCVVGAWAKDSTVGANTGAAYVYRKTDGVWKFEQKLTADTEEVNAYFGQSVAIDSTGTRLVVGSHGKDSGGSSDSGAIYVFCRASGTTVWTQEALLAATDIEASAHMGWSVAMNSDGTRIVTGARYEDSGLTDTGSSYVFYRDPASTSWSQEAKLIASDFEASAHMGWSVAMNSDGTRVVCGALYDDTGATANAGALYVFYRASGGTTWQQEAKLAASDIEVNALVGYSVGINDDATRIVAGASQGDSASGVDSGVGYVFYRASGGTTWQQEAKLSASDGESSALFGRAVSISSDATRVFISAPNDDAGKTDQGAVYVFYRASGATTWTEEQKMYTDEGQHYGGEISLLLGYEQGSVSVSGDATELIVGAERQDDRGTDTGSAYSWSRNETTWSRTSGGRQFFYNTSIKYTATSATASQTPQLFIAGNVNTDTHVYGAPMTLVATDSQGKSTQRSFIVDVLYNDYIAQNIRSPSPQANGNFGGAYQYHPAENNNRKWCRGAVDMTDDGIWMVVGEPHVEYELSGSTYTKAGRAHVYKRDTRGKYSLHTTLELTPATLLGTAVNDMRFGYSVCICKKDNTRLLVGAIGENTYGVVHVYRRQNGVWTQIQTLVPSQTGSTNFNWFGSYLAYVTPSKLVVSQTSVQGSVYIFDLNVATGLYSEVFYWSPYAYSTPAQYPGACCISEDGTKVGCGHTRNNTNSHYVSYFKYVNDAWSWASWVTHSHNANAQDGYHLGDVGMSRNGLTLYAGMPGASYWNGTTWYSAAGRVAWWYWHPTNNQYTNWTMTEPVRTTTNGYFGKCIAVSQRLDAGGSGTTRKRFGYDDTIKDMMTSSPNYGGWTNGELNYFRNGNGGYGGYATTNVENLYNNDQYFPTGSGGGQALAMDLSGDTLAVGCPYYTDYGVSTALTAAGCVQVMRKVNINSWRAYN